VRTAASRSHGAAEPRRGTPPVASGFGPPAGFLASWIFAARRLPGLPSGIDGAPLTTHSCGGSCGLGPVSRAARIPVSPSVYEGPSDQGLVCGRLGRAVNVLPASLARQADCMFSEASGSNGHAMTEIDDADRRHAEKKAKRKRVQDAEVASKTISSKGLLMVNTGPGKGTSTSAFGLVLRALGHGWPVGVVQFVKGAWDTGEKHALERFADLIQWHTMGEGFTWETQDRQRDIAAATRAWNKARELMDDPAIRLLVLDELNIALRYDYLPLGEVLAALKGRRDDLNIMVTGRNAKPELVAIADLVTEMTLVKHHFAAGVKAQIGIEF
jgi:cob(I)alamin adenosyltransferase